jgi:hypothetical protein
MARSPIATYCTFWYVSYFKHVFALRVRDNHTGSISKQNKRTNHLWWESSPVARLCREYDGPSSTAHWKVTSQHRRLGTFGNQVPCRESASAFLKPEYLNESSVTVTEPLSIEFSQLIVIKKIISLCLSLSPRRVFSWNSCLKKLSVTDFRHIISLNTRNYPGEMCKLFCNSCFNKLSVTVTVTVWPWSWPWPGNTVTHDLFRYS